MLHPSFAPYIRQQKLFSRPVKLLFACAGCYWIVIYGFQTFGWIDHDTLRNLRSGQTMIYFVLLTLWGTEYMRETRRLKRLITLADMAGSKVHDVQLSQVTNAGALLTILWPLGNGVSAYFFCLMNIGGLVLATILIVMRYMAALAAL